MRHGFSMQADQIDGKAYDSKLMKRLFSYAVPYRNWILLAIGLLLFITVTDLARPYLIKIAIDEHLISLGGISQEQEARHLHALYQLGLIYFGLILLNFLLNYAQAILLQFTGQKIIYDIRQQVFGHLLKMSLAFFDRNPVGRLVTRVTNDTETLNEMYTSVFINLFRDLFLLIGIIVVMLKLHAQLSLISFVSIPLIILAARIYQTKARQAYRQVRTKLAQVNSSLAENISGIRIIQIFNQEASKYRQFFKINQEHYQANLKELQAFAIFRPSMDFIYAVSLALLIWYGGGEIIQHNLQFGVLYALINYAEQFFRPINDLSEKYNIMQSAMASSERIFQILDTEEQIKDSSHPLPLNTVRGRIAFENVWFAYNEGDWVLRNVSFVVEPSQTVAFVGATGAGKTSIINLISRLYDIQKGTISIDGIDIKKMSKLDLRKQVGVVLQDVFLFAGNIEDNIRLNQPLSTAKIQEIAQYVNASSFIEQLPGGYQEEVKERGATLSTGQKQLLAFARALAFNPAILILDEATANIDTETEALIQEALKKLTRGRTTIVIAHRLSTIQHADQIIVLHKGQIREMGTHHDLLARKGMYYRLYQLQYENSFDQIARR